MNRARGVVSLFLFVLALIGVVMVGPGWAQAKPELTVALSSFSTEVLDPALGGHIVKYYLSLMFDYLVGTTPDGQPFDRQEFYYVTPGGTNNGASPPLLVFINEWMADNTSTGNFPDPADGNFEDWFELHNAGATPVNLAGFYLTDTTANVNQFQIPSGTTIPAGGWLLIWADNEAGQNGVTPNQLHTNFRLSAGGEQLALYTPDGTLVDLITFTAQSTNQSQARYPDSATDILFPVPTPGKRNALTPDIIAVTDAGAGVSAVIFSTEPTHTYQLESTTDLAAWSTWGAPVNAAAATTSVSLPRSDSRRYWRARIVVP